MATPTELNLKSQALVARTHHPPSLQPSAHKPICNKTSLPLYYFISSSPLQHVRVNIYTISCQQQLACVDPTQIPTIHKASNSAAKKSHPRSPRAHPLHPTPTMPSKPGHASIPKRPAPRSRFRPAHTTAQLSRTLRLSHIHRHTPRTRTHGCRK